MVWASNGSERMYAVSLLFSPAHSIRTLLFLLVTVLMTVYLSQSKWKNIFIYCVNSVSVSGFSWNYPIYYANTRDAYLLLLLWAERSERASQRVSEWVCRSFVMFLFCFWFFSLLFFWRRCSLLVARCVSFSRTCLLEWYVIFLRRKQNKKCKNYTKSYSQIKNAFRPYTARRDR